jgi:hypothetical protein
MGWPRSHSEPSHRAIPWPPSGGVERPRRVVRFARLMHRRVRILGMPSARAASCDNLKPARGYHAGWHGGSILCPGCW